MRAERAHEVIAGALQRLGREGGWAEARPYVLRHLATHARLGEALPRLLADAEALDHLDQERLAAEVQMRYFGSGDAPEEAEQILRGRQALEVAKAEDRGAVRRLAGLHNGRAGRAAGRGGWNPRWVASQAGRLHLTLRGHTNVVEAVAFGRLPDGRLLLASGSLDDTVRLWEVSSGRALGEPLRGHTGWVEAVAFGRLADGRLLLASGSSDQTVRLWEASSGQALGEPLRGHTGEVTAVAFGRLADGRPLLASGSWDQMVRLWEASSGQALGWPAGARTRR
ncbi:MAG TPA: hypothetical protein VGO86_19860 [Candidatus Dormibacteraeota bacterium]